LTNSYPDFNRGAAAGGAVGGTLIVSLLGWWYVRAAPHHVASFLTPVNRAFTKKKAKKLRNSSMTASNQTVTVEPKIPDRIGVR
jgi:hypothetical protein